MARPDTRTQVLALSSLTGIFWAIVTCVFHASFFQATLPLVTATWLLLAVDTGYHLARERGHRRRRRENRDARSDRAPSDSTKRPVEYPGVLEINPQLRRAIGGAIDYQGNYRSRGIRIALIPALAVVFLSIQTIFLPEAGPASVGLAAAECVLLLVMVAMIWSNQQPTRVWIMSRIRAELFRREMYLLLAQTGPYLGLRDTEVERVRDARINLLTQADSQHLERLTDLTDRDTSFVERRWIDVVWQTRPEDPEPGTPDRMRTYLEYRIGKQILFFQLAIEKCERSERKLSGAVKVAVLIGVAIAVIYATTLATGHGLTGTSGAALPSALALLAAGIPAMCNSLLAIQNLFASQRLAVSYLDTKHELLRHENSLKSIIADSSASDADTRFHALALHVESTLTQELRRWVMLVNKPEFETTM